jgi:hypothetical protein
VNSAEIVVQMAARMHKQAVEQILGFNEKQKKFFSRNFEN